jgi:hypothetical protein
MRRTRFLPLLVVLLLTPAAARGARPYGGGFPSLDTSARGTAMAGNLVALAGGSEALYWNPAGLLNLERKEISLTYSDLFGLGLVTHTVAQFAWPHLGSEVRWEGGRIRNVPLPPPARRAFGLGISALRGDLGTKHYLEAQFAAGYAFRLPDGTQAGLVYRYLRAQTGADTTGDGSGHAVDLGLQHRIGSFCFGFDAANLASWMSWQEGRSKSGEALPEESDPLPSRWGAGIGWTPKGQPIAATLQINWAGSAFALVQTGAGVEWRALGPLTLRGAYRRRQDDLGGRNEWSAGAGFRVGSFLFDYGWLTNARDLGPTHRWSAAFGF